MTTHSFKIKKIGEDSELHDFEFNIPANESEMEISESLMNPELTFKIRCEIIKGAAGPHPGGGMPIALVNDEGRWNKCDLFKINGLNPSDKTKLEGEYYLWRALGQPPEMKLGKLYAQALAAGATEEELREALDIEDPKKRKDAVIALINSKSGGGKRKKSKRLKSKKRRSRRRKTKRRS